MYIWTAKIKSKAKKMKSKIEKIEYSINATRDELNNIDSDRSRELLSGVAWDSVRNYNAQVTMIMFRLYISWQKEYKEALEKFCIQANKLPNINYIDKELFERKIDRWEQCIEREKRRKHVRLSRIENYRFYINKYREYISSMESFAVGTEGIFDESKRLEDIILDTRDWISTVKCNTTAQGISFMGIETNLIDKLKYDLYMYDLSKCGLVSRDIKELKRLGFTLEDLDNVYISAKEYGEEALIVDLARKNFDKAFSKAPQGGGTRLFVSEYFVKLNMLDGDKEFLRALNIMLKPVAAPKDPRYHIYQDMYINSNSVAREYIDILYSGTELLLQRDCLVMLYGDVSDEAVYNNLIDRNSKMMRLTTLYGSIKYLLDDIYADIYKASSPQGIQLPELCISDLKCNIDSKGYSYNLNYSKQMVGANYSGPVLSQVEDLKSINVKTDILNNSHNVYNQMVEEKYEDIQKEKERLKERILDEIIASTLLEKLSSTVPLTTSLINVAYETLMGNYSDSAYYGRDAGINIVRSMGTADENNTFIKWQAGALQRSTSKYLNFVDKIRALDEMTKKLDKETIVRWFYSGGIYTVGDKSKLVVAGIYNPETNRKIRIVNEEGYKRLIALEGGSKGSIELVGSEVEKDKFYDKIGYSTATEANTTKQYDDGDSAELLQGSNELSAYGLWNGGCDILEDPRMFLSISNNIQDKYNRISPYELSFQDLFAN